LLQVGAPLHAIVSGAMPLTVKILVDFGERASGVPAHLRWLGSDVEYRRLRAGDYLIGRSTVIERKSTADLDRSIAMGRLWRQVGAMRASFEHRFLLVEGERLYCGGIGAQGVRGAILAVADSGVHVIWSRNTRESAEWLHSIGRRTHDRGASPRRRRPSVPTPAAFLAVIPGVTHAIASDLVERFGSVAAIAAAEESDLLAVRGLGPSRVATLKRVLA
jgi:Fanconi anemia group M protein